MGRAVRLNDGGGHEQLRIITVIICLLSHLRSQAKDFANQVKEVEATVKLGHSIAFNELFVYRYIRVI